MPIKSTPATVMVIPTEPVTAGLDFGPGVGSSQPPQQNVNDLLYQMYTITGDTALLQLVDFE